MASLGAHSNLVKPTVLKLAKADTKRRRCYFHYHSNKSDNDVESLVISSEPGFLTKVGLSRQDRRQQHHQMVQETVIPLSLSSSSAVSPDPILDFSPTKPLTVLPSPLSIIHDSLQLRLAAITSTTAFTSTNSSNSIVDEPYSSLSVTFVGEETLYSTVATDGHEEWEEPVSTVFDGNSVTASLDNIADFVATSIVHKLGNISINENTTTDDACIKNLNIAKLTAARRCKIRAGVKLSSLYGTRYVR